MSGEAREAGELLGPELYHEMRYESLVAHPRQECAALCDFLALKYEEAMLHYHEVSEKSGAGQVAGPEHQPITSGLRNWTTQMLADDVEHFEAAAGALPGELGYPLAFAHPRSVAVEHSGKSEICWSLCRKMFVLTDWPKYFCYRPNGAAK
jgi:hypothetical protein